jgi:hypothetical protein
MLFAQKNLVQAASDMNISRFFRGIKNILKISRNIRSLDDKLNSLGDKLNRIIAQNDFIFQSNVVQNIDCKANDARQIKIESKNRFLLFNYLYQRYMWNTPSLIANVGDNIQTIAVRNALDNIFQDSQYDYFDRDNLSNYPGENTTCVMQGWFSHGCNFIPNNRIIPVFVGTHFIENIQPFLNLFLIYHKDFFTGREIGCRDLYTLNFCKRINLECYFSRCLTLTLPRRKETENQNTVFLVDVPSAFMEYIPKMPNTVALSAMCGKQNIEGVDLAEIQARGLLERYRDEAKLVITTRLHTASPCLALGVPVVLLLDKEEATRRFSTLDGLLDYYTLEDLKNNKVDFDPKPLDIEYLKTAMLENLRLSIQKAQGEQIDEQLLLQLREKIASPLQQ